MVGGEYKIEFQKVVRALLKKAGYNSTREIEEATGIPEGTLKPFFSGKTKHLLTPNMAVIEEVTDVRISDMVAMAKQGVLDPGLLEKKVAGSQEIVATNVETVDRDKAFQKLISNHINLVQQHIAAPVRIYSNITSYNNKEWPVSWRYNNPPVYGGKELIGFINTHKGCEPEIFEGDLLAVDQDLTPQENDMVYFQYRGKDACGRYSVDETTAGSKVGKIRTNLRRDNYLYLTNEHEDIKNIMVIVWSQHEFRRPGERPHGPLVLPPPPIKDK